METTIFKPYEYEFFFSAALITPSASAQSLHCSLTSPYFTLGKGEQSSVSIEGVFPQAIETSLNGVFSFFLLKYVEMSEDN